MKTQYINLTGKKYGRWTAIRCVGRIKGNTYWQCKCECGEVRDVQMVKEARCA
jgi:hypothetical protein